MELIKTEIEGLVIIEPKIFADSRGYFFESFSQMEFDEKVHKINFVQDNESMSSYGTLRKGCCTGCGSRHKERVAYIRGACGSGTDGGSAYWMRVWVLTGKYQQRRLSSVKRIQRMSY